MAQIAPEASWPVPEPTIDSLPFWEGLRQGKLLLQRCASCQRFRHYPTPTCPSCHSFDLDWVESSGLGRVHSWTIAHHAFHPAFRARLPYVVVTADLDEGVRLCGMTRNMRTEDLRLDLPVKVACEWITGDFAIPVLNPRQIRRPE